MRRLLILSFGLLVTLPVLTAGEHHRRWGGEEHGWRARQVDLRRHKVRERMEYRRWQRRHYGHGLPPGLQRQAWRRGQLPPGLQKRF